MNLKLLKTHIDECISRITPQAMKPDGSDSYDFFCADVVGNRRFAQNFGGYQRSEIAELNAATTEAQMRSILATLEDYSPKDNPNAGRSDAEIMLGHKSKYLQTATEVQSYINDQLLQRDAARQAAYEQVVAAKQAAADRAKPAAPAVPAEPE